MTHEGFHDQNAILLPENAISETLVANPRQSISITMSFNYQYF